MTAKFLFDQKPTSSRTNFLINDCFIWCMLKTGTFLEKNLWYTEMNARTLLIILRKFIVLSIKLLLTSCEIYTGKYSDCSFKIRTEQSEKF